LPGEAEIEKSALAGLTVSVPLALVLLKLPVMVTEVVLVTELVLTVKFADALPALTVTLVGTPATLLLEVISKPHGSC
jgi:hypothetical protein